MYDRIKFEFQGVHKALHSSHLASIAPLPSGEPELGDEPTQLNRLVDAFEAYLRCAQEETEKATQALNQAQGKIIEQQKVVEQQNISLQAKFEEEKTQMQQEKDQLLTEQLEVKK
jgi:hypothetical protein